ncbi:MAG: hypothetical protein P1U85_18880 [Verrucomicrobiales bacterium]|nr:hypothetical protein [Verrucomicrobiales bacterium]
MSRKRQGWLAGLVGLFLLGTLLILWQQNQPESVVLWSEVSSGASQDAFALERDLRQILVSVNFQGKPFSECLDWIEEKIETELDRSDIRFEISPKLTEDHPIDLRLGEAPVSAVLRYLTTLNEGRYQLEDDRTIAILPISDPEALEVGWFREPRIWFADLPSTAGPIDARSLLENGGISFEHGGFAEYDPERNLLKVLNTRDELELVAAYLDSYHDHHYDPNWKERFQGWWWTLKSKLGMRDPPTPPAESYPLDPFGEIPSRTSTLDETP